MSTRMRTRSFDASEVSAASKKRKLDDEVQGEAADAAAKKKLKKEKKAKKDKKDKKEKKKKKGEKGDSKADAEHAEPAINRPRTRSMDKGKIAQAAAAFSDSDSDDEKTPQPNEQKVAGAKPLSDFRISASTVARLNKEGITSLFPIQALTFDGVFDGKDLIGRARTGMGKTLAFGLPLIERMLEDNAAGAQQQRRGARGARAAGPRMIVLAPTRELAKQIDEELLKAAGGALETLCVYGGVAYAPQEQKLWRGVDIIVGTPGRVIDHIERKNLLLGDVKYFVLDEADRMLDMGFQEDVEKVLDAMRAAQAEDNGAAAGGAGAGAGEGVQTLLFSATLPSWIDDLARKHMRANKVTIDLVENMAEQASVDVRHIAMPCHWQAKATLLADVIACYGGGTNGEGRILIFTQTKAECSELATHKALGKVHCQVLHGDIAQASREQTLAAFRANKFRCLVATDVAARGLDINIDLVVQVEPPHTQSGRADVDTYVHRSGRTGRAGAKGVCVTFYTPKHKPYLDTIERKIGNKLEWLSGPSPEDVIKASGSDAVVKVRRVDKAVLPLFTAAAAKLATKFDGGAEAALAASLACIAGHSALPKARSLLSHNDAFHTFMFKSDRPIYAARYVWNAINDETNGLGEAAGNEIKSMTLTEDGHGAVFDVPSDEALGYIGKMRAIIAAQQDGASMSFSECKELPKLKQRWTSGVPSPGGKGGKGKGGKGKGGKGKGGKGKGKGGRGGGWGQGGKGRGSGW